MKVECFAKTDEMISSNCGTRVAQQASPSEASKTECQTTPCPKTPSPQKCSPGIGQTSSSSFNVSFGRLPSPQVTRRSLRRCSLKQGTSRRKSLPPLQADITELSKAISLDLPEADRMIELLLSSFQYSAEKLEYSLRQTEGFNPETFEQKVNLISEELRHCVKRLKLDGTLQKCLEDPRGGSSDPALDKSIAVLKENIARFSAEDQAWDQLLLSYQKRAEEISRQLQEYKLKQVSEEPFSYLGTSQAHVLQAKPDYQKILDCQEKVFDCMELVLDEIHQVVKICQVYTEDITRYLQKLSVQLASRTFQRLENSPARKLLRLPQTKPSLPQPPEG
ncbi:kinetochore-associated protein DSN1 homolog isoform X2 [Hemicordylus capensis]|nr:kinetochore-associated protein DSN1 homolog isoform X2 [Hemicordylus capensis]XP_053154693.1 kinetochore-associated protein DSN1 homolog isoform X2 [Hemicordylus capensis]